jgi:hypothetical protein
MSALVDAAVLHGLRSGMDLTMACMALRPASADRTPPGMQDLLAELQRSAKPLGHRRRDLGGKPTSKFNAAAAGHKKPHPAVGTRQCSEPLFAWLDRAPGHSEGTAQPTEREKAEEMRANSRRLLFAASETLAHSGQVMFVQLCCARFGEGGGQPLALQLLTSPALTIVDLRPLADPLISSTGALKRVHMLIEQLASAAVQGHRQPQRQWVPAGRRSVPACGTGLGITQSSGDLHCSSLLTAMLAPLMAGNTHTTVALLGGEGDSDAEQRVAQQLRSINRIVARVGRVDIAGRTCATATCVPATTLLKGVRHFPMV